MPGLRGTELSELEEQKEEKEWVVEEPARGEQCGGAEARGIETS